MKLSEYAKKHNVTYRTAYNHFIKGWIPTAYQLESGTIMIPDDNSTQELKNTVNELKKLIQELKDTKNK